MIRRGFFLLGAVLAIVIGGARPASAHASLDGTEPSAAQVFDQSPTRVLLRFNETVEASLGAIRVYDGDSKRIETGAPSHPDGNGREVQASLPELDDGSYVVTWRVISADAHPAQGAFTFQVGPNATANVTSLAERLLANQGGDTAVGVTFGIDRLLNFTSIALLLGGTGFAALVWPPVRERAGAKRIVWGAWIVLGLATLWGIGLQGAYAAGLGLGDSVDSELVRDVLDTRFGHVALLRLVLLLFAIPLLLRLFTRGPRREYPLPPWWPPVTVAVGIGIAATPGLAGHAASGRWIPFAILADTLHVSAISLWLGGVVFLVAVVLRQRDVDVLREPITRFSNLALVGVITIIVTGAFQSVRQVGSLVALRETDYGKLLVLKLLLFGAVVILAAFSREIVARVYRREPVDVDEPVRVGGTDKVAESEPEDFAYVPVDDETELRRLRWSVGIEVVVAIAILAVTAMLVNTAPAREQATGPFSRTVSQGDYRYEVIVTPASAGSNDLHLTVFTASGGATDPLDTTAQFTQKGNDIAPLDAPLKRLGPGHYVSYGFSIPFRGDWTLTVKTLVSDVNEETMTVEVPIR